MCSSRRVCILQYFAIKGFAQILMGQKFQGKGPDAQCKARLEAIAIGAERARKRTESQVESNTINAFGPFASPFTRIQTKCKWPRDSPFA